MSLGANEMLRPPDVVEWVPTCIMHTACLPIRTGNPIIFAALNQLGTEGSTYSLSYGFALIKHSYKQVLRASRAEYN